MKTLLTTRDVIEELGGTRRVREILNGTSQQRIFNWISRGRFPSETFLVLKSALNEAGCDAPPSLWGIVEPERAA